LPHEVDGQVANTEYWPLSADLQLMAQCNPQPSKKFIHPKRFCHIVVGAEIERFYFAGLIEMILGDSLYCDL